MATKPAPPKSSQKSLMPMVVIALWLAVLTGLFMFFFNKPKELDERLGKLEARSGTVSGKINPVGGDQIADIAKKIAMLEKRFEELDKKISADSAEQTKKLEAMTGRLDSLDARCAGDAKGGKPCADVKAPKAEAAKTEEVASNPDTKPSRKKAVRKKRREPAYARTQFPSSPSPSYQSPLPREETKRESPDSSYREYRNKRDYSSKVSHGDTLYDISSRTLPSAGLPYGYMDPVKKLSPGAAIYPVRGNALSR